MIDRWIPILGRWHRDMRLNHPMFWHLQSVYVAAFAVFANVAVIILTLFIPEQPDYITPIEPGFFLLLGACVAVTAIWLRNLLRPLIWKQISKVGVTPSLAITTIHGAILLVPAFVYGLILDYRVEKNMPLPDIDIKLSILTAYKEATDDLNLAELLNKKDKIPDDFWSSKIYFSDKNENAINKFSAYIMNKTLSPYISRSKPYIYYHYHESYWSRQELDEVLTLFEDLYLPDEGDAFTKDKAWECTLWHGLLREIGRTYSPSRRKSIFSVDSNRQSERLFADTGLPVTSAIYEMKLTKDTELDIINIIGRNNIKITLGTIDVNPFNHTLIKQNNGAACNPTIIYRYNYGSSYFRWEGLTFIDKNTLSLFIQFIKKNMLIYGDREFFTLHSEPLKGWPLTKFDIENGAAQLKVEHQVIDRAIDNLRNASYILRGDAYHGVFPWFNNWFWFGSNWMPFICLFVLSSLLIGCFILRCVEVDELPVAAMICALIIGPYIAFANTLGNDVFFYLVLRCSLIGLFLMMFGVLVAAVYRPRVSLRCRWMVIATGLVWPFVALSIMAWFTQDCTDYGCGPQLDIRLPILIAGYVMLLAVGEAYLFLLRRAVIKPR